MGWFTVSRFVCSKLPSRISNYALRRHGIVCIDDLYVNVIYGSRCLQMALKKLKNYMKIEIIINLSRNLILFFSQVIFQLEYDENDEKLHTQ